MTKPQKSNRAGSRESTRIPQDGKKRGQKHVRKSRVGVRVGYDGNRLKNNLGQMVSRLSVGGKLQAYEFIAARLSSLAGLHNAWGWRYIASVHSGTLEPSKKFLRAFDLLSQDISPRAKQYFYFVRRKSFAAVYDKSILAEVIRARMLELGYKPVTFTRYQEIKKSSKRSRR